MHHHHISSYQITTQHPTISPCFHAFPYASHNTRPDHQVSTKNITLSTHISTKVSKIDTKLVFHINSEFSKYFHKTSPISTQNDQMSLQKTPYFQLPSHWFFKYHFSINIATKCSQITRHNGSLSTLKKSPYFHSYQIDTVFHRNITRFTHISTKDTARHNTRSRVFHRNSTIFPQKSS